MPIVAAAIDVTTQADFSRNGVFTLRHPIWKSGGNLYAAAIHQRSDGFGLVDAAGVWKSTDGGSSWTIQDDLNGPLNCSSIANTLDGTVAYFLCGPKADQANVALRLFSFDCATDLWATIDTAGPSAHWASGLVRRSDGALVAVYASLSGGDMFAASFLSGTWGTPADIGGATGPDLVGFDVWSCIDSADRAHVYLHDLDGITFLPVNWWHVSIETDDSIGTVDALPALTAFGGAVAEGANLVLGVTDVLDSKVLVGTPLAAPVFTLSSAIYTDTAAGGFPAQPNLIVDSGAFALVIQDSVQAIFRLAQSTDLSSWAVTQIYDINTDTQPADMDASFGTFPPGLWWTGSMILLASNYWNTTIPGFTAFFIGPFTITVPPSGRLRNTFE